MARVYKASRTNAATGGGYYYVHVDMEETAYNIENNTSTIKLTCRILGYGHSKDGYSGTGAWAGGPTKTLKLFWYDNNTDEISEQASGNYTQGGYTYPSGPEYGEPTLTKTITVSHKEDGTLSGYAKVTVTGSNSSYAPNNIDVETNLTALTSIPRASEMTVNDLAVTYGSDTDNYNISITKNVETYYDTLEIKYKTTVLKTIDNVVNGDSIELTSLELENLWNNSISDMFEDVEHPSYPLTYVLTTYSDSTKETVIGTNTKTANINITGLEPTISSTTFTNSTSSISGLDNIIKNISSTSQSANINLVAGAEISVATIGNENATINLNTISKTFDNTSNVDYTIYVKDSRGLEVDSIITKTLIDYVPLNVEHNNIKRHTSTDNKIELLFDGNYQNGSIGTGTNTLTIKYKIWEISATEPSSWETVCNAITQSTADVTIDSQTNTYNCDYVTDALYDSDKVYTIKIQLSDIFGEYELRGTLTKGTPVFAWNDTKFKTYVDLYVGVAGGNNKIYLNGVEFKGNSESLPLGSMIEYDGITVPEGYEIVNNPTYSTTEQFTGQYWIDGKKIYTQTKSSTNVSFTVAAFDIPVALHPDNRAQIDTLIETKTSVNDPNYKGYIVGQAIITSTGMRGKYTDDWNGYANRTITITYYYTKITD